MKLKTKDRLLMVMIAVFTLAISTGVLVTSPQFKMSYVWVIVVMNLIALPFAITAGYIFVKLK